MNGSICTECEWEADDRGAIDGLGWALCGACRDRLEARYGIRFGRNAHEGAGDTRGHEDEGQLVPASSVALAGQR